MPEEPRSRRSLFGTRDAAGAAAALEQAADQMRAHQLDRGAQPVDEPPTGLLDLAAIRAALGAEPGGEVNPAAARWLAGEVEPEPPSFDEWVSTSDPEPEPAPTSLREHFEQQAARLELELEPEPAPREWVCVEHAPRLDGRCAVCGEQLELEPAPVDVPLVHAVAAEQLAAAGIDVELEPEPAPIVVRAFIPERSGRPVLDWRSRHDERSRLYGVRPRLFGSAPLTDHVLPIGPVLDQGSEGACFGYAGTAARNTLELLAGRPARFTADDAHTLYKLAQKRDEVPGENYTGTSVTGGMAAGVELGCWGGYLWDFGTRDLAQTILRLQRPVIVGITWLAGMYDTGPGGLVQLTGNDEGLGHCLSVFGIRLRGPQGQAGPFFGWQNSWGTGYGDGGVGWVHHRDLAALLHGTGEAAVPTSEPVQP